MPPKKRRFPLGKFIATLVGALPVIWYLAQQIGPRAAPPKQDPIIALNAAGRALSANAAPLYQTALESSAKPTVQDWEDYVRRGDAPLPAELAVWVTTQAPTVDLIRKAASTPHCYFRLQRNQFGLIDSEAPTGLRELAKLVSIRARLASERRDLETLIDSLVILNGVARHAMQQPTVMDQLVGLAIYGLALDHVTVPVTWSDASASDRVAYLDRVAGLFEPLPSLVRAIETERGEYCWMTASTLQGAARFLMPRGRVCGEIHKSMAPLLELARQPVEARADPANSIRVELARQNANPPSTARRFLNVPSMFATLGYAGLERTIDLQIRAVAEQRGYQAVLAVFARRDADGAFPSSLDEIDGEFKIDPYTAQPFIYRPTADGFTLYSAGLDRDDDGGVHHPRWGEQKSVGSSAPPPDGDYIFWPLPD